MRHGSNHAYDKGCRCDPCRSFKREKDRLRRERRKAGAAAGTLDTPHGTETGYTKYYCRCDLCRSAWAEYQREWAERNPDRVRDYHERHDKPWRDKMQRETEAVAHHAGYIWTGSELEQVLRTDVPLREMAERLGRTFKACATARYKARHDPKWMRVVGLSDETVEG
jgi:hypothetical protein